MANIGVSIRNAMGVKILDNDHWERILIDLEKSNYKTITEEEHLKRSCVYTGSNWFSNNNQKFQEWKDNGKIGSYNVTVWCHECKTKYNKEHKD